MGPTPYTATAEIRMKKLVYLCRGADVGKLARAIFGSAAVDDIMTNHPSSVSNSHLIAISPIKLDLIFTFCTLAMIAAKMLIFCCLTFYGAKSSSDECKIMMMTQQR